MKLKLSAKELDILQKIVAHHLTVSIECSLSGVNGDPENVEYHKNNPHEITALEKLDKFLTNFKPEQPKEV